MAFLAAALPPRLAASGQGLLAGVGGVLHAGVLAVAAAIIAWSDIAAAYGFAGGVAGAAILAALVLGRIWPGAAATGSAGTYRISAPDRADSP